LPLERARCHYGDGPNTAVAWRQRRLGCRSPVGRRSAIGCRSNCRNARRIAGPLRCCVHSVDQNPSPEKRSSQGSEKELTASTRDRFDLDVQRLDGHAGRCRDQAGYSSAYKNDLHLPCNTLRLTFGIRSVSRFCSPCQRQPRSAGTPAEGASTSADPFMRESAPTAWGCALFLCAAESRSAGQSTAPKTQSQVPPIRAAHLSETRGKLGCACFTQ
jgi:hypothetical protein